MLDRNMTLLMDFREAQAAQWYSGASGKAWSRSLVCLSVRFAPGFNSDATARDLSVMQVEHYKRPLAGGEKFVTVSRCNKSAPLPAEDTIVMNLRKDPMRIRYPTWQILQISTASIVGSEGSSLKLFSPCKHATLQERS